MAALAGSPYFWNLVTLAIVGGAVWAFWRAGQQPLWIEAFRRLRHNRLAVAAAVLIGLYVVVGLLDSIAWQDDRNSAPRSIFDRAFERRRSRTYSAPLAHWTTGEPHPHRGPTTAHPGHRRCGE